MPYSDSNVFAIQLKQKVKEKLQFLGNYTSIKIIIQWVWTGHFSLFIHSALRQPQLKKLNLTGD